MVKPKNHSDDKFIIKNEAYTGDGVLFNSEFLNNLTVNQAIEKIINITLEDIPLLRERMQKRLGERVLH